MENCKQCKTLFEITGNDREFYDKISPVFSGVKYSIPSPTLCPACRSMRRLTYRNGRTLYQRKCDGTSKDIISVYHPETPFPVYSVEHWYSDKWDGLEYGRDFDFNRPFFEQFHELSQVAPRACLLNEANENSEYTSYAGWNKDCYLVFYSDRNQQSYYLGDSFYNVSCLDCSFSNRNELCYELINSFNCYNSKFIYDSQLCYDSWFLKNCVGCKNCIGCVNLRNKEYCIFNEQCTKGQYEAKLKEFSFDSHSYLEEFKRRFQEYLLKFQMKYLHGINNENVSGDYINNSRNLAECFHVEASQDCAYLNDCQKCNDCYDMDGWGGSGAERVYEGQTVGESVLNVLFSSFIISSSYDILYSEFCTNGSNNLFGCSGLKKQQYCILNKKYSKEEYEKLVPRIIEHMKSSGEFGEFFPASLSPFGYNETQAYEQFPLSKEVALSKDLKWRDRDPKDYLPQNFAITDRIHDVSDDICGMTLACEVTHKNYKIIPRELQFYKTMGLPIPRLSADQRHTERFKLQNPRFLFDRVCSNCNTNLQSSFKSDRPEKILCEKCYLADVY
ncbi:MAG: hypothetical protein Q8P68_00610 [Candidatus Peregrinibacteria bacterium]|nr:hypothetical protein [Candidatus Peregrinibacteria bacterium]MDZ4245202.1 hypothetical protein [Candidatus Gracilibacteria bacterium]